MKPAQALRRPLAVTLFLLMLASAAASRQLRGITVSGEAFVSPKPWRHPPSFSIPQTLHSLSARPASNRYQQHQSPVTLPAFDHATVRAFFSCRASDHGTSSHVHSARGSGATDRPHVYSPKLRLTTVLSILFWLLSMFPYMHHSRGGIHRFQKLRYAGLLSFALGLPTLVPKVYRALLVRRKVDSSCMMLGASIGAVALGDYAEAAAVSSLFAVSEVLEGRASSKSEEALSAVARDLGPGTARLLDDDGEGELETRVPADTVAVGSAVSVPVGEKVPCDGIIVAGATTFDESTITGESRPVRRSSGESIPGGAVNSGPARIVMSTTAPSGESTVARLSRLVEDSKRNRSQTETTVDRLAALCAPPVFIAALLMCTIPWRFGPTAGRRWSRKGLVAMVAACPCPLVISTPVTYVAGLTNAARSGIIMKGGAVLEALAKVKSVALDKTGTLTEGNFALRHLKLMDNVKRKDTLEHLALIESPSSHPLATALVEAARNEGAIVPKDVVVKNHTILDGEGVVASIGDKIVHSGNTRLFQRLGLFEALPEKDKELADKWAAAGETVGFMSIGDHGIVCSYSVADSVRPEAKDVIHQLHDLGIDVYMITGDRKEAAVTIGSQVDLASGKVYSGLLPEEKLDVIEMKKAASKASGGNVLMCGDGVNDAPALALADVGVAMGGGAALAMETSDVTLTGQDLNKLLYSIKLGKRAVRIIVQNFAFSLAAKAIVVGLAAVGVHSLWVAIASDVGTMLIVTTNGLRLLPSARQNQ